MRCVLIEGGDIYTPRHAGVQPLLLADSKIAKLGPAEAKAHALSDEVTTIDATVLVLKQESLESVHLFARGRHVIRDAQYVEPSRQEQQVESGKE